MKTVMIVDDEKPARELLKMLIDWESAGYAVTFEARDGKEALEQYLRQAPDLMITDIQMPLMDGLSLIKEIKRLNPEQNIIVLSCHENFNYAREVMKQGIFDYLIKDSLTPEDMYTALKNSSSAKSDERGSGTPRDMTNEKKSRVLWDMIHDRLDPAAYGAALQTCNIGANLPYFLVHALIDTDGGKLHIPEISRAIAAFLPGGGAICNLGDKHFVILAVANPSHSQLEMLNHRCNTALSIHDRLEKLTGCLITAGVSRVSSDSLQIREKSLEAQQALGYRVFLGKGKILYFDAIQNSARSIKIELIDARIKNIKAALAQKQADSLSGELKNLYYVDLQGIMQYNYIQHVNALLLGVISTACSEFNIHYESLFVNGTIPLDAIRDLETVAEMSSWFTEKFAALIQAMEGASPDHYSHPVRKITQYIKGHYAEDIGLDSIAKLYHIHKVHLARTFKENTGFSVNGYIRELRVQEAKDLLKNSELNVSEILYRVGFHNFQSFYTIFKKHVGVTPMEYRDMEAR